MKKLLWTVALGAACCFGEQKLGQPLTGKEPMALAALMSQPGAYVGKTVQVTGKVTEVCEMAGY